MAFSGTLFDFIANNSRADRLIIAPNLLKQRIKDIIYTRHIKEKEIICNFIYKKILFYKLKKIMSLEIIKNFILQKIVYHPKSKFMLRIINNFDI